jgi:hypothetical protein
MPTISGGCPCGSGDPSRQQRLGHGAVPVLLCLDEVLESTAIARVPTVSMLAIDAEQEIAVGLAGRRRPADALTLALREGIPALVADGPGQFGIDIERDHRDAVDAREFEEGEIQLDRKTPVLFPRRLREERRYGQLARHPALQRRLCLARKHLEADHHIRA